MGVSISKVISSIPKEEWQSYFNAYPIKFSDPPNWQEREELVHKKLKKCIKELPSDLYVILHHHFERIDDMATEKGIKALINASEQPAMVEQTFKQKQNHYHMAISCFLNNSDLFRKAEELLLVDNKVGSQSWKHCKINSNATINDFNQVDADAFAFAVAKVFYHNFDDQNQCCGEIYKRHYDDSLQISVYINTLPDNDLQVQNKELRRVNTQRAVVSAIIYDPKTSDFCSLAGGGKPVHEKIRKAFSQIILKQEPDFQDIQPQQFNIELFGSRPDSNSPIFKTDPADMIEQVRLRRIDLFSVIPHKHSISIDTFAQAKGDDIYDNTAIFDINGKLRRNYSITGVQISYHFYAVAEAKTGKTIHITLKRDSSNLKSQQEVERLLVEKYLKKWKILP